MEKEAWWAKSQTRQSDFQFILCFIVVAPFYNATNSTQGLQYLCILVNTFHFLFFFFISSHPHGLKVTSHCGYDLHFSYD